MRRILLAIAGLVWGLYAAGCGTPPNTLTVYTSPRDAQIFLNDSEIGSKISNYKLNFQKSGDGYAPLSVFAKAPNHRDSKKVSVAFNPNGGNTQVFLALDGVADVRVQSTSANLAVALQGKSANGTVEKTDVTLKDVTFTRTGQFTNPDQEPAYKPENVSVSGAGYKPASLPVSYKPGGEVLLSNVVLTPVSMVPTVDCFLQRKELVNAFFDLKTRPCWGMLRGTDDSAQVVTNSGSKMPFFGLTAAVIDQKDYIIYSVVHETKKGEETRLAAHLEMVARDGGVVTLIGDPSFKSGTEIFLMPTWDPNRRRVYFCRSFIGDVPAPFSINSQGTDEAFNQKEKSGPTTSYLWPDVKPEGGKQIVYSFCDAGNTVHLGREEIDRPSQQALTEFVSEPRFAPKGNTLAYIKRKYDDNTGREKELPYTKDIDGDVFTVTFNPSVLFLYNNKESQIFPRETDPKADKTEVKNVSWIDDDHIVFASNYETIGDPMPNFDIYVMNVTKGTPPKRLTRNASVDDYPVVLKDYIYFRSNRKGTWGIWRIAKPAGEE